MDGIIRLFDKDLALIDSVSEEYEDSFSLESFGQLIRQFEAQHKSFIIARVTTWDLKNFGKEYYSYYDAYQLNHLLFQTQNLDGKTLLHRLQVANPLTNTDIIGDVLYFQVRSGSPIQDVISTRRVAKGLPAIDVTARPGRLNIKTDLPLDSWTMTPTARVMNESSKEADINIVTEIVETPLERKSPKREIAPGLVTRFGVPVKEMVHESVTRRRNLSYANAINDSGIEASLDDWMDFLTEERESPQKGELPFSPVKSPRLSDPAMRDAYFIGTDEVFLESQSLRALFKTNAVSEKMAQFRELEPGSPIAIMHSPVRNIHSAQGLSLFMRYRWYLFAALILLLIVIILLSIFLTLR